VIGNSIFAGERLVFEVEKKSFLLRLLSQRSRFAQRSLQCSRGWVHQTLAFPELIQIPKSKQGAFPKLIQIPKMGHGNGMKVLKTLIIVPTLLTF